MVIVGTHGQVGMVFPVQEPDGQQQAVGRVGLLFPTTKDTLWLERGSERGVEKMERVDGRGLGT
jgi:hypothetical protein